MRGVLEVRVLHIACMVSVAGREAAFDGPRDGWCRRSELGLDEVARARLQVLYDVNGYMRSCAGLW